VSSVNYLIGKRLGKYVVVKHQAHGGMAEVYLGKQEQLDRPVAIKVLHPFLAEDPGFVDRFLREARLVATLRHPNIVQVYDFDHNEELGIYYMVMEYIDGPSLKERLEEGPILQHEAALIAASIADALDYAHRREMVHRDIKPANIMFTAEGQPVLTDFGIARMVSVTGLTASGAMVGTPAYMAPEIGTGDSGSPASDIYSLGVVLYQMLTGRLPFEADVPMGVILKHISDPVPYPSQFVPDLLPSLEAVILKAMAKRPEDRFQTAGEMAQALREAIDVSIPPAATTPTPPTVLGKGRDEEPEESLRRTWPGVEAIAAEAPEPPRRRRWPLFLLTTVVLAVLGLVGWTRFGGGSLLSLLSPTPPPVVPPAVITGTATPAITTTATLTPTATLALVAPTEESCVPRAEVERVYLIPTDDEVPPDTAMTAYITLRNGSICRWEAGTHLALVYGDPMDAPTSIPLEPIEAGQRQQVILPFTAPHEIGEHTMVWEVQRSDGRAISGDIPIRVVVADLPPFTPTPQDRMEATPTPQEPLTVGEPQLLDWQDDPQENLWEGTVQLSARGGTGVYHFYLDRVAAGQEVPDGLLHFRWTRCQPYPLTVIVLSGEEQQRWEGWIPYPAACDQ